MKKWLTRTVAAGLIVAFLTQAGAYAASPAEAAQDPPRPDQPAQLEGKFIWGVLILKLIGSEVMSVFSDWLMHKITESIDVGKYRKALEDHGGAVIVSILEYVGAHHGVLLGKAADIGVPPNTSLDAPTKPLVLANGKENYQGVHIGLIAVDERGNPIGLRNVKDGFKVGDRFKVRVVSTFQGLLVFDDVTPRGARHPLYPAEAGKAVEIPAGSEVILPLAPNQYFQFSGDAGEDKLVVTLRAPQTLSGGAAARSLVKRQDVDYGTNLVQEVQPGEYPLISEAIGITSRL